MHGQATTLLWVVGALALLPACREGQLGSLWQGGLSDDDGSATDVALSEGPWDSAWNPLRSADPQVGSGVEAYERGDHAAALAAFDAALAADPSVEAHIGRAASLYKLGRFDEARQAWQPLAEREESSIRARALFGLGLAQARTDKVDEAIVSFRRYLSLRPDDVDGRFNLEWLLRRREQQRQQQKQQQPQSGASSEQKEQQDNEQQKDQEPQEQQAQSGGSEGASKDGGGESGESDQPQEPSSAERSSDEKSSEKKLDEKKSSEAAEDKPDAKEQEQAERAEKQREEGDKAPPPSRDPQGATPSGMTNARAQRPDRELNGQQSEAVLNALQEGERPMQLWRFQQNGERREPSRRRGRANDW